MSVMNTVTRAAQQVADALLNLGGNPGGSKVNNPGASFADMLREQKQPLPPKPAAAPAQPNQASPPATQAQPTPHDQAAAPEAEASAPASAADEPSTASASASKQAGTEHRVPGKPAGPTRSGPMPLPVEPPEVESTEVGDPIVCFAPTDLTGQDDQTHEAPDSTVKDAAGITTAIDPGLLPAQRPSLDIKVADAPWENRKHMEGTVLRGARADVREAQEQVDVDTGLDKNAQQGLQIDTGLPPLSTTLKTAAPGSAAGATPQGFQAQLQLAQVGAATRVATSAAATSVSLPQPLHSPEFAPAMAARLSVLAADGVQQAQLQLNPADMGPVTVQIALDGQQAQIAFHAAHAATRQVLEQSLPDLAAALQAQGLTLSGGGVFSQDDPRASANGQNGTNGEPGGGRGADRSLQLGQELAATATPRTTVARARGVLDLYA